MFSRKAPDKCEIDDTVPFWAHDILAAIKDLSEDIQDVSERIKALEKREIGSEVPQLKRQLEEANKFARDLVLQLIDTRPAREQIVAQQELAAAKKTTVADYIASKNGTISKPKLP